MPCPPQPPQKRNWVRVLTGTRPGLEWFLLAALPSIAAGSLSGHFLGWLPGLGIGVATLLLGMILGRSLNRGRIRDPDGRSS